MVKQINKLIKDYFEFDSSACLEFELECDVAIKENEMRPDSDKCDESWDLSTI